MNATARLIAGAAVALGLCTAAAQAMPIAPATSLSGESSLLQVRDGCGPYGHRSHYGYCKPNGWGRPGYGGPRPFYGPRPYYGPRGPRCVLRQTYYGPRRVCRW